MGRRGRKSADALSVVEVDGRPPQLQPPASLSDAERAVFTHIAGTVDRRHFQPADMPLLVRYCEATVLAEQAATELRDSGAVLDGRPCPWITVQEKAVRALVALSGRLRLSPQARSPANVQRAEPVGRKPWDH
jgi:phage terminase small subunit